MNLYKKKYLYANGSSVSAGGGFEPIEKRTDVRPFYEKKGIKLPDNQFECSYPYFVSKELNLKLINEAKSGSGIDRLVRTTLDWILDNENIVDQTIFLLEPQTGIRLDWFVFEWQDYGVLNAHKNGDGEYPFTLVKEYFEDDIDEQVKWNLKYKSAIDGYFSNFYDPKEQHKSECRKLLMLLEFMNSRKIDYLISVPSYLQFGYNELFRNIIPEKYNLFYAFKNAINRASAPNEGTTGPTCVWEYARYSELLIYNETESKDNHIGYKGNKIVADVIVDYIKHNNTINYYSDEYISLENDIHIRHLSIKFNRVEKDVDADFIYLGDANIFNYEHALRYTGVFHELVGFDAEYKNFEDYKKSVDNTWPWLRDMDKKNKRFLIKLFHERIFTKSFVYFLDFMEKEYGISRSQIWYVDCTITDYPCTHTVPLELKLRSFATLDAAIGAVDFDTFNVPDIAFRNKKIISLNNKVSFNRLLAFDRILYEYKDHNLLKNENIISMREDGGINVPSNEPLLERNLKNNISRYVNDIKLPWFIDSWTRETQQKDASSVLLDIINYHRDCIFSITSETERSLYYEFNITRDYEKLKEVQFSEKCIVPILGGVFAFILTDGLFYRNMEKIGFDFSYLKKLFDIDYLTNTLSDNINSVSKIARFARSKSIQELNEFRKENYHYIKHNRKLLLDIMLGDCSDTELKFWEQLSGKSLKIV